MRQSLLQSCLSSIGATFMAVRLRVREVAMEKGIGMGKLQRTADVAYNTVKRMFRDPYYITTTETLGKIARALGVPPGELIEEVPDQKRPAFRERFRSE